MLSLNSSCSWTGAGQRNSSCKFMHGATFPPELASSPSTLPPDVRVTHCYEMLNVCKHSGALSLSVWTLKSERSVCRCCAVPVSDVSKLLSVRHTCVQAAVECVNTRMQTVLPGRTKACTHNVCEHMATCRSCDVKQSDPVVRSCVGQSKMTASICSARASLSEMLNPELALLLTLTFDLCAGEKERDLHTHTYKQIDLQSHWAVTRFQSDYDPIMACARKKSRNYLNQIRIEVSTQMCKITLMVNLSRPPSIIGERSGVSD